MNRAVLVAAGMLASRLMGLVRVRTFAHYFGLRSDAADAFNAAFRIPNILQNLFGEGALSASFIPVYAGLLAKGDDTEARRVAGTILSLVALTLAVIVLAGVLATPVLISVVAPGFVGERRALAVTLVRILFPGAGLLVLSAWCLGVLNSHGRFLLSYAAPIAWNAAMIGTLVWRGGSSLPALAVWLAWGSVVGSALQIVVQWPTVRRVAPGMRLAWATTNGHVRTVLRNFVPVFFSRGVVQLSAYVDAMLASLLPVGAVTGITNAQLIYTLPVSLFGMSVAAAELPAMAGAAATADGALTAVGARLTIGLRRVAFFVVPSAMAFLALGDVIASALLQTGRFSQDDARYVWAILAGAAVGLLASTMARLYAATSYALRDTTTPLRAALWRVALTTALGYLFAVPLPRWIGVDASWGAAGLTASAGLAGWVEMWLLRRALHRIGVVPPRLAGFIARLWAGAAVAAVVGLVARRLLPVSPPALLAVFVLGAYGATYLGVTALVGLPEAAAAATRVRSILRRR